MKAFFAVALVVLLVACTSPPDNVVTPPENESRTFLNPGYHEINVTGFYFKPPSLTVYQGDRVKWINQMPFVKSIWIWGLEPSTPIRTGKSWSYVFIEPGFYKYRDFYAQDMEGNITVLPYEERPDVQARLAQGSSS